MRPDSRFKAAVLSAACAGMLVCLVLPALAGASPDARAAQAAKVASFKPSAGVVGTVVTIKGSGFTGATAVGFNGTSASTFTVDSDKQITATVPAGSTSGPIAVTTPSATPASRKSFAVQVKVSLSACSGSGGNRNVPAGTYPIFQLGWDMASSDFLKPFLKSTKTTLTVDGKVKNAQKYWDKKGVDDGVGGWRTDWIYMPRVLLATPGDTITTEVHQLVTKTFGDGFTTYSPGTDLWASLSSCTTHAV